MAQRKIIGRVKGDSAYEIAKKYGFTGTEQEWLRSLKGEKGDKGESGTASGGSSNVDLSSYATKSYTDSKYATLESLNNKADSSTVYSKMDADNTFAKKTEIPEVSGFATKEELEGKAVAGSSYTKQESDNRYALKGESTDGGQRIDMSSYAIKSDLDLKADKNSVYTKSESDEKYQEKGNYATINEILNKANVGDSYTKSESDGKYLTSEDLPNTANFVTRNDISEKADKDTVYTKQESDNKFALKQDIPDGADLSDYYTKSEVEEKISENSSTKTYEKFVVVGITGQSNSVGYDESPLTMFDVPRDPARVMQYSNTLKPLTYMAESIQMMNTVGIRNQTAAANQRMLEDAWVDEERRTQAKTKGIHLPLANLILDAIPEDYGVIIVPGSYGGQPISKFVKGQSYYSTFVQRLKNAMNQNENNIFCGIIWCQGENNCGNTTGDSYLSTLRQLITNTNNELQDYVKRSTHGSITEKDWYFYEWPVYYKNLDTQGILTALKGFFGNRYVPIPDETPFNATMFTSSIREAHFADNSFRKTIAPRVFNAMQANGAFLCNRYDNDTIASIPEGSGGSGDSVDLSNYVDFETYDTLNKRFTLTEKLLEQIKAAIKAGGMELDTKIKVTSDLFTGYGQFVLTDTGANYEGPRGSGTYCKYTSEGYDTFYMDANVQSNTTYGVVVAMNKETKEYLWIYSQTGAVLKNTDSPNANTFQNTNVGAQGLNSALQTQGSFKFIRKGTVIEIYKKNGDTWTSVKNIDFANALTNIGLSGLNDEKAAYVWGFCVGWSNTLNKQDSSKPIWDNLYVDNQ